MVWGEENDGDEWEGNELAEDQVENILVLLC